MKFSMLVIPVTVVAFTAGAMLAAWDQRRERAQRRKLEATLTAVERQQWRDFQRSGGAWDQFVRLITAERKQARRTG